MPGFASRIPRSSPQGPLVETVGDLSAAAEERFWDAMQLAVCSEPRRTGAIYLFGYFAELVLKTALYRALGAEIDHDVNTPLPGSPINAVTVWKVATTRVGGAKYFHDLELICDALVEARQNRIDGALSGDLSHHVGHLAQQWAVWIRYRPETAEEPDLVEVFEAVDFLRLHRDRL